MDRAHKPGEPPEDEGGPGRSLLGAAAQALPDVLFVFDVQERRDVYVNRQLGHMLGFSPEEMLDPEHASARLMHPDDVARLDDLLSYWEHACDGDVQEIECRLRDARGQWRWFSARSAVLDRDERGRVRRVVGTARDITGSKQAERERELETTQVRQRQKLEAIGLLASGVAHEINNPLQGVLSYAEMIRRRAQDPVLEALCAELLGASERIAGVVRALLGFARKGVDARETVAVAELINGARSLFSLALAGGAVALETQIDEGLPPLRCSSRQLQQVLLNLIANARDALLARYPEPCPERTIWLRATSFDEGRWVRLSVEDQGVGVSAEVAQRMFDPFFTTKAEGKGTGLGLSVSLGIVEEHGGHLRHEGGEGATRFLVELPAVISG